MTGTTAERIVSSKSVDWYTPAVYVDAVRHVLGDITLDPASCAEANLLVRAQTYFDKDQDGLLQPWPSGSRIYLNPPYGRSGAAGKFIGKLVANLEDVDAAIVCANAHCTDTRWFQHLWDYFTLCFTDHRVDFINGTGQAAATSTHGTVFAYYGPRPVRFANEFARFGPIVRQWDFNRDRNALVEFLARPRAA